MIYLYYYRHTEYGDPEIEQILLQILSDNTLLLPISSVQLIEKMSSTRFKPVSINTLSYFLQKFATQSYISIKKTTTTNGFEVYLVDYSRIQSLTDAANDVIESGGGVGCMKRKCEFDGGGGCEDSSNNSKSLKVDDSDIMSLLSMPSTREKQNKQVGEEILELLSKPTAKERSLVEKFKSEGGAQVMEFCPHGTKTECERQHSLPSENNEQQQQYEEGDCNKLHFKKIIQSHTDETLGDCSFLNTCFHMDTCKYVHYEVDSRTSNTSSSSNITKSNENDNAAATVLKRAVDPSTALHPAQWIQCDLRFLDMTVLGKFAVIMADPPWDIHMELPYGTMSDDEMRQLGIPALQDDGLIFLWVTGRAMELGRECLKLWGYERFDELIWVKTNQLQRIIRTGRTGHWLNHGKEHCLVGTKGNPKNLNRGLDCDVIVAEVRATSHKPDEIYGIIERLSPGTRKIELFGRPHNVQPNW